MYDHIYDGTGIMFVNLSITGFSIPRGEAM